MAKRLVIGYKPRAVFEDYHASNKRFALTVAHRRAGKTVARINKLIRKAVECDKESPRFGYLAPFFVQAKDIAWLYLKQFATPLIEVGGRVNESDLSITMPHNGAAIRLYGADNYNRMRGLYFDGLAADEAQDIPPSALTSVILPALADRNGWLDVSGTPKGWGNLLGNLYQEAQSNPDEWFLQVLKASKTGLLEQDQLDLLKRQMPENEYMQELECSFDAAITGAYYARELQALDERGQILQLNPDPALKVHTAWDLGISDSTTIWFYQMHGPQVRVIDYYEASGYGLEHYAKALEDKRYNYGDHWAPHDIQVRELGTGKSRYETAASLGIRFRVVPQIGVQDGINAARMMLPNCWFDAKRCATGLDALRQYREKIDEKRSISMGPLHDWTSHAADAFRYMAVAAKEPRKPRTNRSMMREGAWMG